METTVEDIPFEPIDTESIATRFHRLARSSGVVQHRSEILYKVDDSRLLTRCTRIGVIARVAHGYYAEAHVWNGLGLNQRHLELARAVSRQHPDIQFSHATAALMHGFPWIGDIPKQLQCVVGRGQAERSSPLVRRRRIAQDGTPSRIGHAQVTSPVRTVFDVACESSFGNGLACADNALGRRLVTLVDLKSFVDKNQHRKGIRKARLVADLADARIESAGESLCRSVVHQLGFTSPVPQYVFWDGGMRIGRGDFYWPDQRVLLEFDGKAKYREKKFRGARDSSDVVIDEKIREDRIRSLGIKVIRLTWGDLAQPEKVERLLVRAGVPRRL